MAMTTLERATLVFLGQDWSIHLQTKTRQTFVRIRRTHYGESETEKLLCKNLPFPVNVCLLARRENNILATVSIDFDHHNSYQFMTRL